MSMVNEDKVSGLDGLLPKPLFCVFVGARPHGATLWWYMSDPLLNGLFWGKIYLAPTIIHLGNSPLTFDIF